ncbi:MAG: hypothetical protein KDE47_05135, partial [Caldilineaceae bacterium]|nr:hypothetical protein [Caldilineaceae bacterium]
NYQHYTVSDHDRRAAGIIAQIPVEAKVSAQDKLDPHVAGRQTIYIFPKVDDADTLFVDVTGPAWPQHPNDLYRDLQAYLAGDFGIAAGDDGYLLLRKGAVTAQIPDDFYNAFRRPLLVSQPITQPVAIFGGQLALWDHQVTVDEHGETVVQLTWQLVDAPVATDYRIYVAFADRDGNVLHDTLFYPPVATLWYPTSLWQRTEMVLVQTLPWSPAVDQVTLLVGVYRGDDGWNSGQRLPLSTASTPTQLHLENNTVARVGSYQNKHNRWELVPLRHVLERAAQPVDTQFGGDPAVMRLARVQITHLPTRAGEPLDFALEWHAGAGLAAAPFDYSLFAHLLNEQGEKVAQLDWQPHDDWGPRPMTTWFATTALVDQQQLLLPADLR